MRISDWSSDVCSSDLRVTANVEAIGHDLADVRHAVLQRAERAKTLRSDQDAIGIGDDLHIAAHRLVRDRIEAIVINDIFPRHCGWRRQIVDELRSEEHTSELQ